MKQTGKQPKQIEFRYYPKIFFFGFEDTLYSLQDMHKDKIINNRNERYFQSLWTEFCLKR
jgi:hypothetical protein